MKYYIGELYKYPKDDKEWRLKSVRDDGQVFCFHGGHCVTDNVFCDLIRVRTGSKVSEDNQLELF